MSVDLRVVIAQAIADALNDTLDEGYEPFGDGINYETLSVGDVDRDGRILIDGLGAGMDAYVVEVRRL